MTTKSHLPIVLAALQCALAACQPARASGSNALDRINFGDPAFPSRPITLIPAVLPAALPPLGLGALRQTYRAPYGSGGTPARNQLLQFTLVD